MGSVQLLFWRSLSIWWIDEKFPKEFIHSIPLTFSLTQWMKISMKKPIEYPKYIFHVVKDGIGKTDLVL